MNTTTRTITDAAITHAKVCGATGATQSVSHPRLATGELIPAEWVRVWRQAGATDFEASPVFTTEVSQPTPEGRVLVDVLADGRKVGRLVRFENGNWVARSETDQDLVRPTTVESAFSALVELFIESDKPVREPDPAPSQAIIAAEVDRDVAVEEALQALKRARQAAGKLESLGKSDTSYDALRRLTTEVRSLANDLGIEIV